MPVINEKTCSSCHGIGHNKNSNVCSDKPSKFNDKPCCKNISDIDQTKVETKTNFVKQLFKILEKLANKNRLYKLIAAISNSDDYVDAQKAAKLNTNDCIKIIVKNLCYFLPDDACTDNCKHKFPKGHIPFTVLNDDARLKICRNCIINGEKLFGSIAENRTKIYIVCTHQSGSSDKSPCKGQATGFVSLKECDADHIVPIAAGGIHDIANIQFICKTCNVVKGRWFSKFDTLNVELFHDRYKKQIKKYLKDKKIKVSRGIFILNEEQLDDFSSFANNCVVQFIASADYHSNVYAYIKKYHKTVFKKHLEPLVMKINLD